MDVFVPDKHCECDFLRWFEAGLVRSSSSFSLDALPPLRFPPLGGASKSVDKSGNHTAGVCVPSLDETRVVFPVSSM